MKKNIIMTLMAFFMVSGCSISWLNPFSEKTTTKEENKFEPNPFLWQAALDKLSFMPMENENINTGIMETKWSKVHSIPNEEFKIKVQILASSLRTDCLKVEVYKRLRLNNQWQEQEADRHLAHEIEMAILNQSRILYRKSLINKEN